MENKEIEPTAPVSNNSKSGFSGQLILLLFLFLFFGIWYSTLNPQKKESMMHGADSALQRNDQLQRAMRIKYRDQEISIGLYLKITLGAIGVLCLCFTMTSYGKAYKNATGKGFFDEAP